MVDLDTFLVAVYTEVDTLDQMEIVPQLPLRPGPAPHMSDSEVLTLDVVGQWRGSSERELLRWAEAHLTAYFPVILSQSAFNRRVRRLGPICTRLMFALADTLGAATAPYQIVDSTPVPLARQCRGERHRLFADGPITGFVVAPANTQDRRIAGCLADLPRHPGGHPVDG